MHLNFKRSVVFAAFSLFSVHALSGPTQGPFKATVILAMDSFEPSMPSQMPCPNSHMVGLTIGSGNASHLGKISFVGNDCVNVSVPLNSYPVFSFSGIPGTSGTPALTITAANGDKLYATYYGSFVPDHTRKSASPALLPYKVDAGAGFSITGGTGRFQGAQGKGTLTGVEDLDPSGKVPAANGKLELNGTISY